MGSPVKIRRLPETDLARIAPLSQDAKRRALQQVKFGIPPFSWEPIRRTWSDILNVQPEMFGPTAPTSWAQIERLIRQRARPGLEYENNIELAGSLYNRAIRDQWRAVSREIYPLSLSVGIKVEFWLPLVLIIDDVPLVPFFDPRRSSLRLTEDGRRFAFSVMNERIRLADPDLAEVGLGVFQFDQVQTQGRVLRLRTDEGVPLYSFDELDQMVAETYKIWEEVLADRDMANRRQAGGKRGTLL
jgi:hypothetical protein